MRTGARVLAAAAAFVVTGGAVLLLQGGRDEARPAPDHGTGSGGDTVGWTVVFTGFGTVTTDDGAVELTPRSAASPDDTHAGLVRSTESFLDADFEVTVRTETQVRRGTPNAWEVGWVLWNLRDNDHFYAVALKPNGWEVSKQDPAYPGRQRFLVTGDDRVFPVGRDYRVRVHQDWPRMTVSVDGEPLATVVDDERPYRGGYLGLYTEDARVRFTNFTLVEADQRSQR